jgi:hypothetical protein
MFAGLDVTGTQVCASTLASVSAAAVASIFGVTGTIAGAAVVSVIATTGSAVYSHGIRRTGAKLQQTPVAEISRRVGVWPRAGDDPTVAESPSTGPRRTSSSAGGQHRGTTSAGWRQWLAERRWGVVIGVAVVFVASLATVTLIELAGQHSLAEITGHDDSGRTSIGSLFDGTSSDDPATTDTSTTIAPDGDPGATDVETPSDSPDDTTTDSTPPATDEETPPVTEAPSDPAANTATG